MEVVRERVMRIRLTESIHELSVLYGVMVARSRLMGKFWFESRYSNYASNWTNGRLRCPRGVLDENVSIIVGVE